MNFLPTETQLMCAHWWRRRSILTDIAVLGIDLGKTVCSLAGLDRSGAVIFRKRVQRFRLLDFLAELPGCIVAMEACGGAHHIGRFCLQHGHEPRLTSPLFVRPYVKVHKNDDCDAEAIAKTATRPTMSLPLKSCDAPWKLYRVKEAFMGKAAFSASAANRRIGYRV